VRWVSLVAVLLVARAVRADDSVLATTPRAQGLRLYAQATKMFDDQDFVAAAVTFGQAQSLLARVDRDPKGAVIDAEAHSYRSASLSNKATAYSRAGLYVEALAAFGDLRDQFGPELTAAERTDVDDAVTRMADRIGTVVLKGLPTDEDVEVRFDGRLERRDLHVALRMSEGDHAVDVEAKGYKPFVAEFTIVGKQQVVETVALEPLKTPARMRIEAAVPASKVEIDGVARGEAPVEVSVPPGKHRVVVGSESFVTQTTDVELKPGERTIVKVGLVHAHAPLGIRFAPSYVFSVPLLRGTPLGSYNNTIGIGMFHDALRIRTLRFGLLVEYTPRNLNQLSAGITGTVCPDQFMFGNGAFAWCLVTGAASYVFGGRDGMYTTGQARARAMTTLEYRRGVGFARASIGGEIEDYLHEGTLVSGSSYLVLWSGVAELSAGLDL
jgi:hypothetical protein